MPIEGTPITGPTGTSLVTAEEAATYFSGRLRTDPWDLASDDDKTKALIMATRAMSALSWDGDEIPDVQAIKDACCEEAFALLLSDSELEYLHVVSQVAAGINTTVDPYAARPWAVLDLASPKCWKLIAPYLVDLNAIRIERA